MKIEARIYNYNDIDYAKTICKRIEEAAIIRKTGIAKRDPEYIKKQKGPCSNSFI